MKKLILPLLMAGCFAVPSIASAATNPYVSLSGGLGLMSNSSEDGGADAVEYGTGYVVNGSIGLKTDYARLEAEIGYHNNSIDSAYWTGPVTDENISIWSFMANGYLDYDIPDAGITPYIMAGLGIATVDSEFLGGDEGDSVFAWQIGAGVGFKAADKVTIDVGYRYFATDDASLGGYEYSIASHNIIAGVRIDL